MKYADKLKGLLSKVNKHLPPPLREILSENGVGSYSRYSGFLIILATIGWTTYLVWHNHAFPDMTGPTAFVAGGQAQYIANQAKNMIAAAKSGKAELTGGEPDANQS